VLILQKEKTQPANRPQANYYWNLNEHQFIIDVIENHRVALQNYLNSMWNQVDNVKIITKYTQFNKTEQI